MGRTFHDACCETEGVGQQVKLSCSCSTCKRFAAVLLQLFTIISYPIFSVISSLWPNPTQFSHVAAARRFFLAGLELLICVLFTYFTTQIFEAMAALARQRSVSNPLAPRESKYKRAGKLLLILVIFDICLCAAAVWLAWQAIGDLSSSYSITDYDPRDPPKSWLGMTSYGFAFDLILWVGPIVVSDLLPIETLEATRNNSSNNSNSAKARNCLPCGARLKSVDQVLVIGG